MSATADRKTYDAWQLERLAMLIPDEMQRARIAERRYPRPTAQVVEELVFRGFAADEQTAERFADRNGVEILGDQRLWFPTDVDHFADFLEGAQRFSVGTRHRMERGISWEQDR